MLRIREKVDFAWETPTQPEPIKQDYNRGQLGTLQQRDGLAINSQVCLWIDNSVLGIYLLQI